MIVAQPDRGADDDPDSELEFARVRRAVELGLVSEDDVEDALVAADDEANDGDGASEGLLDRLGIDAAQRALLDGPDVPEDVLAALRAGARLVGRFVTLEPLGAGGMAEVVAAWDLRLARRVALKWLRRFDDDRARAGFEREARLAASLSLPSVAAIHEVGEHEGRPYIAMQLIEGETLARCGRGAPPEKAAAWIRDAARAVGEAHARGVVHRDLKPSNVMVDRAGRVFVMDFGLARAAGGVASDGSSTVDGGLAGTPEYMAPEQARGGPASSIDARADVWALGACLFDLLTGRPPFASADRGEVIAAVLRDPPPRPGALADAVPPALEAIVLRCLERDPARRYATARELAADLDRFLAGDPVGAPLAPRAGGRVARSLAVVAAGVATVVAAVAGPLVDGRRADSEPALLLRDPSIGQITALAVDASEGLVYFGCSEAAGRHRIATVSARGGPWRTLYEAADVATGIALVGAHVYWSDMNSGPAPDYGARIYRARRDGEGAPEVIYEGVPGDALIADPSGLASDGSALFAVDQVGGAVYRVALDGSRVERVAAARYDGGYATEHANAIAVDLDGTVFVADAGLGGVAAPAVIALGSDGAPARTLHAGAPLVRPMGIAVGRGSVLVVDPGAGNAVWRIPRAGGPPELVTSGPPFALLQAVAWLDEDTLVIVDLGDVFDSRGVRVNAPAALWRVDLR